MTDCFSLKSKHCAKCKLQGFMLLVEVPDLKGDVRLTSEIGSFQYLVTLSEYDIKYIFFKCGFLCLLLKLTDQ